MDFVNRISFQHLILRDQTLRTLGEEDFVAESNAPDRYQA